MKFLLKKVAFNTVYFFVNVFSILNSFFDYIFPKNLNGYFREQINSKSDSFIKTTIHKNRNEEIKFDIYTPNQICSMRHRTFSEKEPETLEWMDEFGGNGIFFDIGANIGIYSIYYALTNNGKVFSFEPSVFNLRQLAKNISINNLQNKISIIPNPLSDKTIFANFKNGNDREGGALSSFAVDYGFDGKKIDAEIEYNVMGFSLDELIEKGFLKEFPSLIKIDVDGIEHLILKGAKKTLKNATCKSISIEVNENFKVQSNEVSKILKECGFKFRSNKHSKMSAKGEFSKTFNQVWVRV